MSAFRHRPIIVKQSYRLRPSLSYPLPREFSAVPPRLFPLFREVMVGDFMALPNGLVGFGEFHTQRSESLLISRSNIFMRDSYESQSEPP